MSKKQTHKSEPSGKRPFVTRFFDMILPIRIKARDYARQARRLEAFLGAVSEDYCGWSETGLQAVTKGFVDMLGVDDIRTFPDIQNALAPDDAAALESLFTRMKETGERFDLTVTTSTDGMRCLRFYGAQGRAEDGDELFNVIWAQDITNFARTAEYAAKTMAAAQQREAEFRRALEHLPYPVWIRNEDLNLVWVNKFYAETVGESVATVIADQKELPVSESKKESGGAGRRRGGRGLARRAIYDNTSQSESKHIVIEGDRRLLFITEVPIRRENHMLVGVAVDITRMEELESELGRFTASSQEVLEHLQTAVAIYDADTRLEFYNSAYAGLWGLEDRWLNTRPRMSEVLDRLRESRMLPEQADFRKFKQDWQDRFTKLLTPYEEMMYLPDGKALRSVVMPHPMGGLMLTLENVTSRLELESQYNTLIAVQQETIDSLSEGLAVFGEDGRLQLWNPAYARIWKLNPEDLEGAPHVSRLIEKVKARFTGDEWEDRKTELISAALTRDERKGRIEQQDGLVLNYTTAALPDGAVLNSFSDVTDSVRVEKALIEKNVALEEAERLKLDFLANVSYQLRTPLNALMGFAEILGQQYFGPLNERQQEYTQGMMEAGQKLVSLINDILDLSTIEAGYLELQRREFDVYEMIQTIKDLTQDWVQTHNLKLKISCKKSVGMMVGDERRLKQVLINLVQNAINFSEGGGTITLSAIREGNDITFQVRDTGIGIAPEHLARVFTPFERARQDRRSGAGLGLTLVKSIIELHGGGVKIESALGKGTTVICSVPAEQSQPAAKSA